MGRVVVYCYFMTFSLVTQKQEVADWRQEVLRHRRLEQQDPSSLHRGGPSYFTPLPPSSQLCPPPPHALHATAVQTLLHNFLH